MSVQPTSEKRTVLQLSGSAAIGHPTDQHGTGQPHQGGLDHEGLLFMPFRLGCSTATRLASADNTAHGGSAALPGAPVRRLPDRRLGRRQRGGLPRIRSAAFSAIMIVGAFRLPETMLGMIEASTTRSPSSPRTRQSGSTTRQLVRAHPAGASGVVGAVGLGADEGVDRRHRSLTSAPGWIARGRGSGRTPACAKISRVSRTQARISSRSRASAR